MSFGIKAREPTSRPVPLLTEKSMCFNYGIYFQAYWILVTSNRYRVLITFDNFEAV